MTPTLRDAQSQTSQPGVLQPNYNSVRIGPKEDQDKSQKMNHDTGEEIICFFNVFCYCWNPQLFQSLYTKINHSHSQSQVILPQVGWEAKHTSISLLSLLATDTSSQMPTCSTHYACSTQTTSNILWIQPPGPCWKLPVFLGSSAQK